MSVVPFNEVAKREIRTREANPDVVKQLEALLDMAKSGEIVGFAYAVVHQGDLTSYHRAGRNTRGMIGALVLLQGEIVKCELEDTV